MAAPSRTVPHPGRALVLLLVLILAMLLGILGGKLFSPSQWQHQFKVGLGLDLSSGTQVTLQAQTLDGKAPSSAEMNAAVGVIESRVNGTGNSGAQVKPQGTDLLVVTVPGKGSQQTIQLVSQTALLMFRQVLLYQPYGATSHAGSRGQRESLRQREFLRQRDSVLLGEGEPHRQLHQLGEDLRQDRPGGQRLADRIRERHGHRVTERFRQRQPQCQPEHPGEQHHVRGPEPGPQGRARALQQAGLQAG